MKTPEEEKKSGDLHEMLKLLPLTKLGPLVKQDIYDFYSQEPKGK